MGAQKPRLPAEYQQVEWIGASGTQYINTGIVPNNFPIATIDFESGKSAGDSFQTLFGTQGGLTSGVGYRNRFSLYVSSANTSVMANMADGLSGSPQNYPATATINVGTAAYVNSRLTYQIDAVARIAYVGNISGSFDNQTIADCINPLYVLATNNNGSASSHSVGKLYGATYEDGNGQAFNLIPCYRKADGVIGVYDTVGKQFLTNAGTGTFTKGADV